MSMFGAVASHYVVSVGGGSALQTAMLAPSPALLYMCDEASGSTLADSSGGGNNMTITGSVSAYQATLGGTLKGITWPNSTSVVAADGVPTSTQDFTICAFVYMPADIVSNAQVFSLATTSGSTTGFEHELSIIRTNGTSFQPRLRMNNGALRTLNGTSGSLALNTRYFIAAIGSGTNGMRLRVNKVDDTTTALNAASGHGAATARIHDGELTTSGTLTIGPVGYYRSAVSNTLLDAIADAA